MRQRQTDFWSLCHKNIRMHPAESWNRPGNWALMREFKLSTQPALACENTSMLESSAKVIRAAKQ